MKYYRGSRGDKPFAGGQKGGGNSENYNFLPYDGNVFGGFWPGRGRSKRAKEINLTRLGARGEDAARHVTVVFFAPSPKDGKRRLVGWYEDATVYRRLRQHPADGQEYNVTARSENAHRIPVSKRKRVFEFDWWHQGPHRFGEAVPLDVMRAVQRQLKA
jgi:hypothetical protein